MFWIKRRPLTALFALALALRVASAVATEFHPIFPAYYYTDADNIHSYAVTALKDVRAGRPPVINGALSERIQTQISLTIYRALGPKPFAVKLLNSLLGALAVAAFSWALSMVFSAKPALLAGLALAVWPSHVFYTSQNLKEAPVGLLVYAALGCTFASGFDARTSRRRAAALALGAGAALLAAGLYRSHVQVSLSAVSLTALGLAAAKRPRANVVLTAAAILAALLLHTTVARALLGSFNTQALGAADKGRIEPHLIPVTFDNVDSTSISRPTSPEGITRFRNIRQSADQNWAMANVGRVIGTQIYPEAVFKTWLDVLFYLPKGAFTVLFMPLPGLYPMEGKLGRWAAAAENAALLTLALLAAAGITRGAMRLERLALLALFAAMTAGAALLEFDLGSAGRHKLLYLPIIFPFAAEEAMRMLGNKEPA